MLPESMFINRTSELNLLNNIYKKGKAELILLYGRRRFGKTRLLQEFIKDKDSFYFIGDISADILKTFEQVIKERFVKFQNWDDFFDFLTIEGKKRVVVVLDEFQYLYKVEKAWPTIMQRRWEDLKNTKIMIILCGSIVSSIYKIAMGYGSALYGRKTYEIELSPLSFFDSKFFMKKYSMENFVYIYTITGGIPRYLEEMNDKLNIWENIKENIANKNCFLYREPLNLFYEEFKNPSVYLSIIHSLSEGGKKFNEISSIANISMGKLTKYLNVLERVKIIKKIVPVTEKKERTRNTIAQESWIVVQGSVECIFYDIDDKIIEKPVLYPGDASFTLEGGHTYKILEDNTLVYEYKTGPYEGQSLDKVFI